MGVGWAWHDGRVSNPPTPTCVRHPDRATGLACTRCGRPACPECLRPAAVGQHCVECVRQGQRDVRPVRTVGGARADAGAVPYVTYGLIAVNVLVYVITAAQAGSAMDNYRGSALFREFVLVPRLVADGEFLRLLGSGFLHYGAIHLLVNMFALYIVGRDLERVLGRIRYACVYLISLLGGSAAVMALSGSITATAGASGAVYGLFGAVTVTLIRLRQSPTPMLVVIGVNVLISFSLPGISLWGHLGGLAAGTLGALGILFAPGWLSARTPEAAQRIGWAALGAVAVACLAVIVAATVYLRSQPPVILIGAPATAAEVATH
ncbi:rhomboid family intramembrane serine protease [Nocardia mangyaensis]|uniref:rhomboid family intramembrane serine protease n=1 Tax=Nocardia mangyaensis TaxID=2213200 RepID=UPI0026746FAB|nr:rhomboid family intramembrane serine protease [Nocardia mangyaensis]MDO3646789.1 rhomboid family intramembrane serine protease [Nocardia mangyaensis]